MEKEKTFMENAGGFMSAWKDDYSEKNKDILERKKKRDLETQEINQAISNTWAEIKSDMSGTSKELFETLHKEFDNFTQAVSEGTADLAQKIQLEKHVGQLKYFMEKAGQKGKENFTKLSGMIYKKISEYETELKSEKENIALDANDKSKENTIDNLHNKIKDVFNID